MNEFIATLAVLAGLYWLLILRPGRVEFWIVASKHPDAAYEHFKGDPCCVIFENHLPKDYRVLTPKRDWVGPFLLNVPKLGNKTIRIFGKRPAFEQSQNLFLARLASEKENMPADHS